MRRLPCRPVELRRCHLAADDRLQHLDNVLGNAVLVDAQVRLLQHLVEERMAEELACREALLVRRDALVDQAELQLHLGRLGSSLSLASQSNE